MPTIGRFFDSDAFIRGLMGPFGSGKSSASVVEIAQRALRTPPGPDGIRRSRWAIIRNTIKELEDTTEKTFLQWFPPGQFGQWTPSKHNYLIKALKAPGDEHPAHIEIMFRALDRPDQLKDLLSLELTGAWVNEAREVPWAIIEAVSGRLGRFPRLQDVGPYWYGMWMDTNPPDVDSEWFKFFEVTDHSEAIEKWAAKIPGMNLEKYLGIFKQPSGLAADAENLENLQPGYYERLAIGKSPDWVKVYIHGEYGFVVDGRPVWPEYKDSVHCPDDRAFYPKPIKGLPIYRGWDFGLTPACVYTQITPRGQWIIFDEQVATGMGADRFSDDVLEYSGREYPGFEFRDIGDPAGMQGAQSDEKTCFQVLHAKNIRIEPGLQTLQLRLDSVRAPLNSMVDGRPRFVLHPRCTILRRGMLGGYHYRRLRTSGERYSTDPDKGPYSHICDALGYVGTRLFGGALITPQALAGASDSQFARGSRRSGTTGY